MNNARNAYCRLCAELKPNNKLKNLQTDEEMCEKIISKLTRFNIEMDFNKNILPKTVCLLCTKSLDRAFTFVTAVEQAQAALSEFILIQTNANESNMNDESIFDGSTDEGKELPVNIKGEDNFYESIDVKKDNNTSIIIREEYNIVEIKPILYQPPNKENEEINIKDENINCESPELNYDDTDTKKENIKIEKKNIDLNNKDYNNYDINVSKEDNINNKIKKMPVEYPNVYKTKKAKLKNPKHRIKTKSKSKHSNSKELENEGNSIDFINKEINRLAAVPIQHIRMTWGDFCWMCSLCETQFSSVNELQNHAMQYHNTCNPYTCPDCNTKKLRLDGFVKHVRTHRKYLHYSCYMCDMKFSNPVEMRRHKSKHKVSEYMCPGCNTNFESKHEFEKHSTTFYKNMWKKKTPEKLPKDDFTCTICNKSYKSSSGLRYHLVTHTDRIRNHVCEICGKAFYKRNFLKEHMILHSDVKLYPCEICKHSFKNIYQLRYHVNVHSGIKPFTCDECGKCFRLKRQLANHLVIHTDSLPFVCTFCNKGFRAKTNLKNHMHQHTGVKPYSCGICPRDFTNWANWNKHMNRKHGMEMAKKKRTPQGPHAVDPATGKIIYPELDEMLEWKKKMKEPLQPKVKPGRMKVKKTGKVVIYQDRLVSNESVVGTSVCESLT